MYFLCVPEPLTTVRNLRVYDPSTSSLSVRWDHAEGNPRQYKLFYAPAGGPEELVIIIIFETVSFYSDLAVLGLLMKTRLPLSSLLNGKY